MCLSHCHKICKWYDESLLCCHRVKICNFAMNKKRTQPLFSPPCASATYGSAQTCRRKNVSNKVSYWPTEQKKNLSSCSDFTIPYKRENIAWRLNRWISNHHSLIKPQVSLCWGIQSTWWLCQLFAVEWGDIGHAPFCYLTACHLQDKTNTVPYKLTHLV